MKNIKNNYSAFAWLMAFALLTVFSCKRDIDELEPATFPTTAEVFIDGFSAGLAYAAFGGSDVTAFDTDTDVKYKGTTSMKFAVPDAESPNGSYAGGVFYTETGRDLSGYDALTFWAKASKAATIDLIGFGNDLGESKYQVSLQNVAVNSNWKKYIIPIPDASLLVEERGMLFYSEGPENGLGYTFWMDEVKFEKLGTLAHPEPFILEGQDQVFEAETGQKFPIGGLGVSFNLPTGIDQNVYAAPTYFTLTSSNPGVASINKDTVCVVDAGTAIVTAMMGDLEAVGSFTVQSTGTPVQPLAPAPAPTVPADSVISLFSNVYNDVPVDTWNTGWQFSTAETFDIQIDGDDVKRYRNLNFVGIEFTSQTIDITNMTHFHMDIWTPDMTSLPAAFRVLLVDFGADNTFDGGDDSSHELAFTQPTLASEQWVSLDVPLTDFAGLVNRANLAQMVLSGDLPNVYVDNVYFYDGGVVTTSGPTDAAPVPTQDPANVISIFSDTYTNVPNTDFNPDWGQATVVSQEDIAGNNTLIYAGLNYQGIQLEMPLDASGMTHLHLDFWTENSSLLNVFLISNGPVETPYALSVPTTGWASVDIPLTAFDPVVMADLIQFKFDGNGNIYLDNIYFYNDSTTGGGMPDDPAPMPTQDPGDVISVFSDTYTNIMGTDLNPDWGQATVVSEEMIMGNNTLVYSGLNYQGLDLGGSQDVSGMTHLHLDVWTDNSSALNVFLISSGPIETPYALTVPTSGWASFDIPLADFDPVDLADIIQFKFEGNGDIYIDNIYFYNEMTGGGMPTDPAPDPMQDPANVVSVFSDTYTNIMGTDLNPNWGQATVVSEEMIMGNNTLVYSGLNYQGLDLGGSQDVSGMTHLHLDFWTDNSDALNVFLISPGPIETPYALTVPTVGWASVDIPLGDFAPVDLADVIQFKFDGNGDIYLDNIYFYDDSPGGGDMPTDPAPDPTFDPSNVISIFSDTYTNVAGTDLNPNWGQATVVTEELIGGNNTLVYTGLNYQGIQLGSAQDVSGMTHLHLDFWTANSGALNVFLISSGPIETPYALTVPTSGWSSVDIPLGDFAPVDLADIIQFKFDGDGDIYLDNIFFHNQ